MARRTLRLLEYERLRVGESLPTVEGGEYALTSAEFDALLRFDGTRRERIFDVGHQSLRFRNFVGFLQVGRTGIEILPKVDRDRADKSRRAAWRDELLHMLRIAGRYPVKVSTDSSLAQERGTLLDVFAAMFLDEVERITREGLAKTYRPEQVNLRVFAGRLNVREQIRRNLVHQERFAVERSTYDADQLVNHVLRAALGALAGAPLSPNQESRRRGLSLRFEALPQRRVTPIDLDRISLTRKTAGYALGVDLAGLILRNFSPSLRAGGLDIRAIVFDMNALWEAYVATVLRRAAPPEIEVRTQSSHLFWSTQSTRRNLRPDLVLNRKGEGRALVVLDTKWKIPKGGVPADADLKQMFAYNELLSTPLAVLLYPAEKRHSEGLDGYFSTGGHRTMTSYLSALRADTSKDCNALLTAILGAIAS